MSYNYEKVTNVLAAKSCKLAWTKKEFDALFGSSSLNIKTNIPIISSCSHKTIVQFNNILYTNTGVLCKECVYAKMSKKTHTIDYHIQEFQVIKGIIKFCKEDFQSKICCDGCLVDFYLKPIDCKEDTWLPIQMKTTYTHSHGIYGFHIQNTYKDMYVMLFSIIDQRIWMIPGNTINIKKINIGLHSSIYDEYEIASNDLILFLKNAFKNPNCIKMSSDEIDTPISISSQREQEF